jgi:hypothetical protein
VQPGRDRARPARAACSVVVRLHGQVTLGLPMGARVGVAGGLSTPGMGDRLGV